MLANNTTATFTSAGNKIPNVSDQVKKADYDNYDYDNYADYDKYFTTSHYNKFTSNTLDAKITQKKVNE